MGLVRLGLAVLMLSGCFAGVARAQTDESKLPPTDYGAGHPVIMFNHTQAHPLGAGVDTGEGNAITLTEAYPLMAQPLTPDAQAYNAYSSGMMSRWWRDIGGPKDNSVAADPDTDYTIDCEATGPNVPIVDNQLPSTPEMLPGVISMVCIGSSVPHMQSPSDGRISMAGVLWWGANWLVAQHRPVKASDIFIANSGWLKAATAIADADRDTTRGPLQKLDYADSHRWVLTNEGLGFAFRQCEFNNFCFNDEGYLEVIPWSKLASYLRKDGIIPRADWSATVSPAQ
jgi:hypothetical protein